MRTFKIYYRHNGKLDSAHSSAPNDLAATFEVLAMYPKATIIRIVSLDYRNTILTGSHPTGVSRTLLVG